MPEMVECILDDSDDASGYLVKGDVTDQQLVAAIRKEYAPDFELSWAVSIERAVMRKVPSPWHDNFDFLYWPSELGRGAFECTIAWMQ